MQDDKVIDLRPYIAKKTKGKKRRYKGERICCPECDSHEYWKCYAKFKNGKLILSSLVCTSDDCDGETEFAIEDGIIK